MKKSAAVMGGRQAMLFDDAPPMRPKSSDERARADMMAIIATLAEAKVHPWSARLLGWQLRTFAALSQRLTPLDAAALQARLDSELERLGPAED
jgi:hypothetical protein